MMYDKVGTSARLNATGYTGLHETAYLLMPPHKRFGALKDDLPHLRMN